MIAFTDVEKAFDNVDWNVLFKALKDLKIDYRDRRIIFQLYKNQMVLTGQQKLESKISKEVRQNVVYHQFNIYIEEALKEYHVKNTWGVYIFADDIALVTDVIWRSL